MKDDSDSYTVKDAGFFPKSDVLLLFDLSEKLVELHPVSRYETTDYDSSRFSLVSSIPISEFQPYFMLYDEAFRISLIAEILTAIRVAGSLAHKYRKAAENPLPRAFKRLARKLVRCYQHYLDGGNITEIFVSKIYRMIRQIWRDAQLCFRFSERSRKLRARLQNAQPIEYYGLEC